MLHNKLNINLVLLFVFLFLVSCTQNDKTEEGKVAIIRLLVSSANSNVNTRSSELTTAEEDVINDIHILVYNSLGELIGHKYTSYNPSNPAITVETRSSNSNCTIYAIANTGSSTYFNGKAYSEDNLKTLVTEDLSSVDGIKKGTSGSQYFLMSGSIIVSKIDPGTSTVSSSLSLSRLAAKIKFNITASNGITITDYSIKNIPKNSYLVNNTSADAVTNYLSSGLTTLSAGTTSVSDQYFYMYENRKGGRTGTGTPTDQTGKALYAPVNSTYIEIHAKSSTFNGLFKIYLGADNISDYNIKRNNSYTYDIQLLGPGYADTRVTHYGFTLAATSATQSNSSVCSSGLSNCYIVSPGGTVYIPVIRANQSGLGNQISDITSSTEWTASLLWQTSPGLVTVSNDAVARTSGCFKVSTNGSNNGNAVVVVKNVSSGNILWSWHIWITDYNPDNLGTTKNYNGLVWMDRNLGSTSVNVASSTDITSLGLLYEWGRKDPFPGASSINVSDGSYSSLPIYGESSMVPLTEGNPTGGSGINSELVTVDNNLSNSVRHPNVYYFSSDQSNIGRDWYTSTNSRASQNDALWNNSNTKTVYDPCPAGWRVPISGDASASAWYGFTTTGVTWNYGYTWNNVGYYPSQGCRYSPSGSFYNVGKAGYLWAASVTSDISKYARGFTYINGSLTDIGHYDRAHAFSIRCVKE